MPFGTNSGYSTYHYSQTTREAESRMDTMDRANECMKAGTHRPVCVDGAYGMRCPKCGEFYFRENPSGY